MQSRSQKCPAKTKLCLVDDHVLGWPAKANFKLLADQNCHFLSQLHRLRHAQQNATDKEPRAYLSYNLVCIFSDVDTLKDRKVKHYS